jgi:hypothetical protein
VKKICFISGHRDISENEFREHYENKIFEAINQDCSFVLADCRGVDEQSQKFLKAFNVKDVKVYHMFEEPRYNSGFECIGGFQNDIERDTAMTEASDYDIAWVRPGKERSGTAQNIERRKNINRKG